VVAEVAGGPSVVKRLCSAPSRYSLMSRFERLVPSASTLARTVGTGLPTFPLGLTEEMVMVPPPEPVRPPPLLVSDPVRLVALLTVRSTTFFGFGTCETPYSCLVCSYDYYSATSSAPNSRR
jgi:hypothetical protein